MEHLRAIILFIGWPVLILGSIYAMVLAIRFWRAVGRVVIGKLVLAMIVGWLISMYSLGITATAYMFTDIANGVAVVFPVFIVWFITMVIIIWTIIRWGKEAVTLNAFYKGLEELIRKRTEELEKTYQEKLESEMEIRALRERFVSIAAHELRAPGTAIEWGLNTILEDQKFRSTVPQDYINLLENLRVKNRALLTLVGDILQINSIQKGKMEFESERVVLKDIIIEIRSLIESGNNPKAIVIRWTILEQSLPAVHAHPIYIKEIITNLLTNALRYNKPNGLVAIDGEIKNNTVVIRVKDTGIGMTPDESKGLFQEFYRVKNKETKDIEGTGLGLFISKELTDQMKGKLWVKSEKGKGTTFYLSLPADSDVTKKEIV